MQNTWAKKKKNALIVKRRNLFQTFTKAVQEVEEFIRPSAKHAP
jgi:hypothetical protein